MVTRLRPHRFIGMALRPWWRLTRGVTLGAQAVVIDGAGHVLLVRHGYRPGWCFPGGGVERGETVARALERELLEETGVRVADAPALQGVYSNHRHFPGDHIALFVVREWTREFTPSPTPEIAEQGFFAADALPEHTDASVRRRLAEILEGTETDGLW
ncbi:MAG: NUDIX domain-containing protein [Pseudomonadota bacterium]|nr:NUDIX domain-containing protein [Pseudomonadota bacterium]